MRALYPRKDDISSHKQDNSSHVKHTVDCANIGDSKENTQLPLKKEG
jgi:hypothetical protein